MSLKTRLVTAISMFCLVLSLMMVGVWAVQTATVNIGGTVSFNAKDIYATITGKIEGANPNPTLATLNYSASNGDPDTSSWANNALTFDDSASDIKITFTITVQNLSGERSLFVIVNDNSTVHANIEKALKINNNNAGATTYESGSEVEIKKNTTAVFTFTFDVKDENAGANLTYGFDFKLRDEKQEPETSSVDLKWYDPDGHTEGNDSDGDGYYYVEMGTVDGTANGEKIKWRLVGHNGSKIASNTKPTSGQGTFILETNVAKYKEFNVNYSDGNDYATSDIREYLKGDYVTALNLANDEIYKAIDPRSVSELYQNMAWRIDGEYQVENCTLPTGTYDTTEDSLWLMSVAEIYTLVGGGTISNNTIDGGWSTYYDNLIWNEEFYWLRSPNLGLARGAFGVGSDGGCYRDGVDRNHAVRPAFNLNF